MSSLENQSVVRAAISRMRLGHEGNIEEKNNDYVVFK
jgi:hypothetical protein